MIFSKTFSQSNTNLSNGYIFDGEPFILYNDKNPGQLIVAWMGFKLGNNIVIKYRISNDYGETWQPTGYIPHTKDDYTSADPSIATDKDGNIYLCFIDHSQNFDSGGVFVTASYDNGSSWITPVKAIDMYEDNGESPIDRPWMVIDTSGTDKIYITSKPVYWDELPNRPYYKSGNYTTWEWDSLRYVDGGTYPAGNFIANPVASPCVSPEGVFYAVYPSYVPSNYIYPRFILAKYTGSGFEYSPVCDVQNVVNDTLAKLGTNFCIDPSNSLHMAFIFEAETYGDADLFYTETTNGGNSWTEPIRINDDPQGNGKMQDLAWGSFNENGDYVAVWRDRRNGTDGYQSDYDIYCAFKNRDSSNFSQNIKVNDEPLPFDTILNQNGNDFLSVTFRSDTAYMVWGDTRTGKLNIFFSKVSFDSNSANTTLLSEERIPLFYPNPAHNTIFVTKNFKAKKICIYNSKGKKIATKTITQKYIDINNLPRGTYIFKAGNISEKVVVE